MKTALISAALSATVLVAAPAAAQTASAAPVGGRVEAVIGYDRPELQAGPSPTVKDKGFLYGIGAGYDFPVSPSMSVGVDVEATGSTAKSEFGIAGNEWRLKTGRDLYAGGRVTFPVSPVANLYVKGGYTNLRVDGELNGIDGHENLDGWRAGAGGQIAVAGRTYVGAEYRFSNYEHDLDRHQVALTVGTRF